MTHLSIVVACRDEQSHIVDLLDSILSQDLRGIEWEAIISDGLSKDRTRDLIATYSASDSRIRMIDNPGLIVSTGLNAAIRAANGDIIIRMDAHTTYAEDYCRSCLEELERTGADNVGGAARTRATGSRAKAVAAAFESPFSTGGAAFHDANREGWVDTVPYGCWRKSTLIQLGLFDESLVRNQDDELNLRIIRSGGRIWQSSRIRSWYSPRPTIKQLFRQYFQYGFWKVAVIRKHKIPSSWRHLVPSAFVVANIFCMLLLFVGALANQTRTVSFGAACWTVMLCTYAALVIVASGIAASRSGWETLWYLPPAFVTFHLSYGIGFLAGIAKFTTGFAQQPVNASETAFNKLSR